MTESVDDSQAQLEDLYECGDLLEEQDNNNIDKEEFQSKTMVEIFFLYQKPHSFLSTEIAVIPLDLVVLVVMHCRLCVGAFFLSNGPK